MTDAKDAAPLPLAGLRVIEFSHTVMGPAAGLILADLGADVVKVEAAPAGDSTRQLRGFAAGFFAYFNRNKRSLAVDLKTEEGRKLVHQLVEGADIVVENFGPGTMERLGCGYEDLAKANPGLVYCALKGFLPGPYEHRAALDEVVQFMGGLAYMTGPPGRPLRAGTSVIDITGGMFGVIAILAALRERDRTGKGQLITSALFETTVFLMGQHMAASAIHGEKVPPMSARRSAWSIYKIFMTADGDQLFLGVVSDKQWQRFCEVFERPDLGGDPRLATNGKRIAETEWLLPALDALIASRSTADVVRLCEAAGVAFSPVAEVEDLFDDPHLRASGGLLDVELPGGKQTRLPRLPVRIGGHSLGLERNTPGMGEHTREVLAELGLGEDALDDLEARGVVSVPGGS
jgi:crotonobetainyl-CoA:carnitine CoA-transferase CaiB-like acyl-CoA transferase